MDFQQIKCCLLDLDGTVYLGTRLIEGAKQALQRMREKGITIRFLTNNSSRSQKDYHQKLLNLGLDADASEIYTSSTATLLYLKAAHSGKSVYLLGTQSLKKEFLDSGISLTDQENADIVVVAYDTELEYHRLCIASRLIAKGAFFIATHPDLTCPAEGGSLPDVGSFLSLIKTATGKDPSIICGKPYKIYADGIINSLGFAPHQIAMMGDRLMTDMRFAINNGFKSVLVLSGEATREDLEKSGLNVDFILPSIAFWDKK